MKAFSTEGRVRRSSATDATATDATAAATTDYDRKGKSLLPALSLL